MPQQSVASSEQSRTSSLDSASSATELNPGRELQLDGQSEQSASQEQAVTALSSVVLPALEAALHRRSHQLSMEQKKHNASQPSRGSATSVNSAKAEQDMALKRQTHDQIRKCMSRISRLFKEIDHWDAVAPVSMGDGVEGVLEGFLEEVLCRVEAEDA